MLEILYIFFILIIFLIIYKNCEDIYKIYTLVYTHKTGICIVLYYTSVSISKIAWRKFHNLCIKQPCDNLKEKITIYLEKKGFVKHSVVIKNNKYLVTLNINNKIYKIFIKKLRPPSISQIIDENENDVTQEIEPFLLAKQTVITELTPGKLGKKSLHFSDEGITYNEDDII